MYIDLERLGFVSSTRKEVNIFVLGCVWLCILVKEDLVLFQMQER